MARITFGSTGLTVERNGFGALPIQRIPKGDAVRLLQRARGGGIEVFDTARGYTDSEEKLGEAFSGRRDGIVLATKTPSQNAEGFWKDLHTSLTLLRTDYIDLYQFHNPAFCPRPGGRDGLYDAMLQARQQGKVRFIGITNHRLAVAEEAVESGLYDALQFPFSYLSTLQEQALVRRCFEKGMGFLAMKALSGGLITNAAAACAWLMQFPGVVPIWGVQREKELDDFLGCINAPVLTEELAACIETDRQALGGEFCRGCGYCMPCPQGIEIHMCARASLLLRRAPREMLLSESGERMMRQIEDCVECGQCAAKCPYGLDTPSLLKRNYQDYCEVLAGKPL